MDGKILKLFIEKGLLLDKEMLNFFNEIGDENLAKEVADKIKVVSREKIITKDLINNNFDKLKPVFFELEGEKKKAVEKYFVNVSVSVEVKKEIVVENVKPVKNPGQGVVKILSSPILASQELTVKDFVKHFRNRYNFFKGILQERQELEGLTSIDKIGREHRNFSIIGLVNSKRITQNKNLILEVEDLTGRVKVLINQNKEDIFEKGKGILLDDVVGFKCSGSGDFVFVNDLFYPEAALAEKKKLDEEVYALFVSDIHLGSGNFLEENFKKFINWLNGEGCDKEQKEILKKIKYMFIVGDSVDGVGVYPGQEKELVIKDIREQYVKLAEYLDKIPKHIQIVQCAGQHDAVRVAEPQPPMDDNFAEPLHQIENLTLVSNPSLIEIGGGEKEGIKVLMYHGASMHGFVNEIEELRLSNGHQTPAKVAKHLLKRRHLAPTHGSAIYIPNKIEDSMLIKEIPDIMTTGDFHKPEIEIYNNILLIACSCWQSMTAFEEKVGNKPDPCKVPLLNLKTREIKILDFE
jgi:DNA polymerase II small subunit